MPFDGVDHRGARFIPAYAWHPESIASGGCLSSALAASYAVSRHHATNIGSQSYFVGRYHSGSTFVDLAQWRRYIPEHATHILVDSRWSVFDSAEDGTVHHRVKIKVGSTTDTGATVSEDIDTELLAESQPMSHEMEIEGRFAPMASRFFVEVSSVAGLLPSQSAIITASGYAEDAAGNAANYFPHSLSAWWVSIG